MALAAGRALHLVRPSGDRDAQADMQPRGLPARLRRAMAPATGLVIAFIRRKYGIDAAATAAAGATLARELEGLRAALAGRAYLLGQAFSCADVAMAVTLQFVAPVDPRFVPLGAGARAAWTQPELAERFADLIAWRDELYARHRPRRFGERAGTG